MIVNKPKTMSQCVGIKHSGERCTVMVIGETPHPRCAIHTAAMFKVGPNNIRRNELKYANKRAENIIFRDTPQAELPNAMRLQRIQYLTDLHALEQQIARETAENGGNNADQPFIEHERQRRLARHAARMAARQEARDAYLQRQAARNARVVENRIPQPVGRELAELAADRQNVHTDVVVEKVKRTVETVLKIPVPPEYQTETLKTSGEIILECGLTKQSAWQMMSKYCADDDIYDMGHGIYGRVLNSVWQYIKASPHKEDLKKILAVELKDNIGMCAQGNLSRLCNILSGYLDGVDTEAKSKNEIIGERFSAITNIIDLQQRVEAGHRILEELQVPAEEHGQWLEALTD